MAVFRGTIFQNINGSTGVPDYDDIVIRGEKPIETGRRLITDDYVPDESVSLIAIGDIDSPITITLPKKLNSIGRTIMIQDEEGNASTNSITIQTEGGETINGATSVQITTDYGRAGLYSNGNNWLA